MTQNTSNSSESRPVFVAAGHHAMPLTFGKEQTAEPVLSRAINTPFRCAARVMGNSIQKVKFRFGVIRKKSKPSRSASMSVRGTGKEDAS